MDNFIVSARKYRPELFSMVVGQFAITNTLRNAILKKQIAHAFLFTGPRGVGKTTCARIMAKTINCENPTADGEACNQCTSCTSFNSSSSFNIYELDAASNNSVDDIRNLVDQVRIPPQMGKYKVYIIDEVHMLSSAAFNAFLKTLEEPPLYAKFILATTEKHKILPTILSRCQIFDFKRITIDDIAKHLEWVAKQEDVNCEPDALHIIAQKSDGALRDALSMFDQLVSFTNNNLSYSNVIESLNVLDYDYYFKLTTNIIQGKISETLIIFNEILDNGFDGSHFISGLSTHFRNLLVCQDEQTVKLLEVGENIKKYYLDQAKQCKRNLLIEYLKIAENCDINYKAANNKRLLVEIALMQMCELYSNNGEMVIKEIALEKKKLNILTNTSSEPKENITVASKHKKEDINLSENIKINDNTEDRGDGSEKKTTTTLKYSNKAYSDFNLSSLHINGSKSIEDTKLPLLDEANPQYANEIESKPANDFTQNELDNLWEKMSISIAQESPNLLNTLMSNKPIIYNKNILKIEVDNSLQKDDIFEKKYDIVSFLKKGLNNYSIELHIELNENNGAKDNIVYTDKEKFNEMLKKNPSLNNLKEQLGLDFNM